MGGLINHSARVPKLKGTNVVQLGHGPSIAHKETLEIELGTPARWNRQ